MGGNGGTERKNNMSKLTQLLNVLCALLSHSVMSDSATPWTVARQAPLSMGFFRQEYWSGLPFPFPGDLPNSGIEARSPVLQADSLSSEPPEKLPQCHKYRFDLPYNLAA